MKPIRIGLTLVALLAGISIGGCGGGNGELAAAPPPMASVVRGGAWELWGATAGDIEWRDTENPDGGKEAKLVHDPHSGESVSLANWPIKASINETPPSNVHIFNIAGTFALMMNDFSENVGPSGYVLIPKGTTYTITCANAGRCVFFVHRSPEVE